jgi:hypothetical protein
MYPMHPIGRDETFGRGCRDAARATNRMSWDSYPLGFRYHSAQLNTEPSPASDLSGVAFNCRQCRTHFSLRIWPRDLAGLPEKGPRELATLGLCLSPEESRLTSADPLGHGDPEQMEFPGVPLQNRTRKIDARKKTERKIPRRKKRA